MMTSSESDSGSSHKSMAISISGTNYESRESFLEVDYVQIHPRMIVFSNPFQDKKFEAWITITNTGKNPANIRILDPTSSSLQIKTIKQEKFIPSGLKIRRKVTYVVSFMSFIKKIKIPIFINSTMVEYIVYIKETHGTLTAEPNPLDFGAVDAGPNSIRRSLIVTNGGRKPTRYIVDISLNDIGLTVEPARGIIMEMESTTLTVELRRLEQGDYTTEFWIICDHPIYVSVHVNVANAIIEPIDQLTLRDFTFMRFPRTYFGAKSYKTLLIRNLSQNNTLFCVTSEKDSVNTHLSNIQEKNSLDCPFNVCPLYGHLPPNDIRPFILTFRPFEGTKRNMSNKPYFVIININKVYCKISSDKIKENLDEDKSEEPPAKIRTVQHSFVSDMEEVYEEEHYKPVSPITTYFEYSVRLLLCGEVEIPSVTAQPNGLIAKDLVVNETGRKVISLTNNSNHLPIIYKYKKTLFVEVDPCTGLLEPLEKRDITVYITPKSSAILNTHFVIDLLYYDEPNIYKTLSVIGSIKIALYVQGNLVSKHLNDGNLVSTFQFKKPNCKPNNLVYTKLIKDDALLALPNDRPITLKGWKDSKITKTIYAAIPRIKSVPNDEFEMTYLEKYSKKHNTDYYFNYLRTKAVQRNHLVSKEDGYEISMPKDKCVDDVVKKEIVPLYFIPLSPPELFNIEVSPRSWVVENVGVHSIFPKTITISNKNNNKIQIALKSQKPNILFPNGHHFDCLPNSNIDVGFECSVYKVGVENYVIDVIINDNHIFETSLLVTVIPKGLKFSETELLFRSTEPSFKYLKLSNEFTSDVSFFWDYVEDFNITPKEGIVLPGRTLTCEISYEIGKCKYNLYHLSMRIDNRQSQIFVIQIEGPNLSFVSIQPTISFGSVGSSIFSQRFASLTNHTTNYIPFFVREPRNATEELVMRPMKGVIPPNGQIKCSFSLKREKIGEFSRCFLFIVGDVREIKVSVTATIIFPTLDFFPERIKFSRMAASSFDIKCVEIINTSDVDAKIMFDTEKYPELHFSEYSDGEYYTPDESYIIQMKSARKFCLHLHPFFPLVTSFPLPLIVNNQDMDRGAKASTLPKLRTAVLSHRIYIKRWKYEFTYFPHFGYNSITDHNIEIVTKLPVTFCIRLDALTAPFVFECVGEGAVTQHPASLVCKLNADEKVYFKASFEPSSPGNYSVKLPVFINHDVEDIVHNYLVLEGVYHEPKISHKSDIIYMGLLPLNFEVYKTIDVILEYHNPDCNLYAFCNDANVTIKLVNPLQINEISTIRTVQVSYVCCQKHVLHTVIVFKCCCGSLFELCCEGACENTPFTNYACVLYYRQNFPLFQISINPSFKDSELMYDSRDTSSASEIFPYQNRQSDKHELNYPFPFFPDANDDYTKCMEEVINIVELWLYKKGFYGLVYHKIPDSMCEYEINTKKVIKRSNRSLPPKEYVDVPLLSLLRNLFGKAFPNFTVATSRHPQISFILYDLYYDVMCFLEESDVICSHIRPEFLFPYSEYYSYMEETNPTKILEEKLFYQLSKQCWLDLVLQVYKSFVYMRLPATRETISNEDRRKSLRSCSTVVTRADNINSSLILLSWINIHLDKEQKFITSKVLPGLSTEERIALSTKRITNFDTDLSDGLGFLAVTLNACPYFMNHFATFYVMPTNDEQAFHNACLLIECWTQLKMSFIITAKNFMNPNLIMMSIFLSYLYDFFAYIKPSDTISIFANLSETNCNYVTMHNEAETNSSYNVIFFDNQDGLFSVTFDSIIIPPLGTFLLNVDYNARFLRISKTTILLSGENIGQKSAKSKAFNLEGIPEFDAPYHTFLLNSPLNKISDFCVNKTLPLTQKLEYELYISETRPIDIENLNIASYQSYLTENRIIRVRFNSAIITTNESGKFSLSGIVCSVITSIGYLWCFLRNDNAGDIMIQITINTTPSQAAEVLFISLPQKFCETECSCDSLRGTQTKCQRNVILKIPAININMWKCLMQLILYNVGEKERHFWDMHQGSSLGLHLLNRILSDNAHFMSDDMKCIFRKNMKYAMTYNNKSVSGPKEVEIVETSNSDQNVEIVLHLDKNVPNFSLSLESVDDVYLEIRNYDVIVQYILE